jgi:hypothetical protein
MVERGYPSDDDLEKIREWDYNDVEGLFEFIKSLWCYPHLFETRCYLEDDSKITKYIVSTGGWSGNESIISALEGNVIVWITCWVESRRGGHYIFEHKEMRND